ERSYTCSWRGTATHAYALRQVSPIRINELGSRTAMYRRAEAGISARSASLRRLRSLRLLAPLGVQELAAAEHGDQLGDAPRARLRLLGRLHAPQDGVAVRRIDRRPDAPGARVVVERRLQIGGHRRGLRRVVGRVPAAVALGALDLGQAGRHHLLGGDERR